MSFNRASRFGFSSALALAAIILAAAPVAAQDAPQAPKVLTLSGGTDVVSTYMFRGIRQNSDGVAVWPWLDLGIAAYSGEGAIKSVNFNIGSWNSSFSEPKSWYESDIYATLGVGLGGGVAVSTTYTSYMSPDDLFTHTKEIAFKLAFDDSEQLGAAALTPYVFVGFELATEPGKFQADGGEKAGRYLELGIAPGYSGSVASLAIPVKVGFSAGNYYELAGVDNKFGFFSVAGIVTVPLGSKWNVHGGVEAQALGDTTKAFNGGDSSRVIGSVGLGFAY